MQVEAAAGGVRLAAGGEARGRGAGRKGSETPAPAVPPASPEIVSTIHLIAIGQTMSSPAPNSASRKSIVI